MKIIFEYPLKFNTRLNNNLPYNDNTLSIYCNAVVWLFEELLREITLPKEA